MNINSTKIILLCQDKNPSSIELIQLIRQLSLLWKFEFEYIEFNEQRDNYHDITHLLISYLDFNEDYEEWCCDIVQKQPLKQILLFDNYPKIFGQKFKNLFGVDGIDKYRKKGRVKCTRCRNDDLMFNCPEKIWLNNIVSNRTCSIKTSSSLPLIIDNKTGACFLSNKNNKYCISIDIWQLGVPTFPVFFKILRNFIFFSRKIVHLSPFPYVSIRIDDYPITSQQYIQSGVDDDKRLEEIKNMISCSTISGAKMDFMVSSKIFDSNGFLKDIADVVPKSLEYMKILSNKMKININAHGKTHLNEGSYLKDRTITPYEFNSLDRNETEQHLLDNIRFIELQFSKHPKGFVPPSWGYNNGITKHICSKYFDYIIDSSQNYRKSLEVHPLGYIDDNNLLHLIETWHLGNDRINYSDASIWNSFLDNGIPIHMMVHGPYVYGVLPKNNKYKYLFLFLFMCALPVLFPLHFKEIIKEIKKTKITMKWGRFEFVNKVLIRYPNFRNATLQNILMAGKNIGVDWCFTDDLAIYLRAYHKIKLLDYFITNQNHIIKIYVPNSIRGSILLNIPFLIKRITIDKQGIVEIYRKYSVKISNLQQGVYSLTIEEMLQND